MTTQARDPRTGLEVGEPIPDTTPSELDVAIEKASKAARAWVGLTTAVRAGALRAVADALEGAATDLVAIADAETALGKQRLLGEVGRTAFQLRMFAADVAAGQVVRSTVEPAVPGPPPSGHPDLRRTHRPLGVVAVFGASNFPFAFSVLGGDTASALAAGNAVVAKVHPSHPNTSHLTATVARSALTEAGVSPDLLTIVDGFEVGPRLVQHPSIKAVAFTGSTAAGRVLFDLAQQRPEPIPFYGELGSVNPVVATTAGLRDMQAFVTAYLDSLTLGAGQFCTNPGLLLYPEGCGLRELLEVEIASRDSAVMLSTDVRQQLQQNTDLVARIPGSTWLGNPLQSTPDCRVAPALLEVPISSASANPDLLATECFGPVGVLVSYTSLHQAIGLIRLLPGCLVATIHADENEPVMDLIDAMSRIAGRVVWNEWPTGVAVAHAQQHGGPYPSSTSSLHTSVGATAVDRFLRPIAYQNFPNRLLPDMACHEGA